MISVEEFKNRIDETGDDFPLLTLAEFFDGNDDEYSIAPNQADEGRPQLSEIYERFKALENDDGEELMLCGDSILICTCLKDEEIEALADCEWLQSGGVSELDPGEYINCYPEIPSGYRCLSLEWD